MGVCLQFSRDFVAQAGPCRVMCIDRANLSWPMLMVVSLKSLESI
jgi:hypothetical protein